MRGALIAARWGLDSAETLPPARDRERFVGEVLANMATAGGGGSASRTCCRWRPRCRAWPGSCGGRAAGGCDGRRAAVTVQACGTAAVHSISTNWPA